MSNIQWLVVVVVVVKMDIFCFYAALSDLVSNLDNLGLLLAQFLLFRLASLWVPLDVIVFLQLLSPVQFMLVPGRIVTKIGWYIGVAAVDVCDDRIINLEIFQFATFFLLYDLLATLF